MSVLACGRKDCENVMCDHLIFGNEMYICNDCLEELKELIKTWQSGLTAKEVEEGIRSFMRTTVGTYRKHKKLSRQEMGEVASKLLGTSIELDDDRPDW